MTAIRLTFPWGRYYAHPWGINPTRLREAEWPPSPWRLLRALVSAWFRAHPGQPPSSDCVALVETLGRQLPEIGIGKVSFGHTVHWQPNYGATSAEDKKAAVYKKTRHENHFVAVHGPVFFRWSEVSLSHEQSALLRTLLAEITYFGRAESLCHAELCESELSEPDIGWCKPTSGRKISSAHRDVFCPKPADFRFTDLWSRRADNFAPDGPDAPPHLVDKLLESDMKPDGAAWVSYQMPKGWPNNWVVRVPKSQRPKRLAAAAPIVAHTLRFSLQCRIPIPLKATVDIAERFRQSGIKRFKQAHGENAHSFALSGHEPKPEGVEGDHQHAHFLPLAVGDSFTPGLAEILIWAPCGFTQAEVEALMRVQVLYWGASKHPIRPVLTGIDQSPPAVLSPQPAQTWQSLTPYVPPRHFYRGNLHGAKLKQSDAPENQLAQELARIGIQSPVEIKRLPLNPRNPDNPQAQWDIVRAPGDNPAFDQAVLTNTHSNGSGSKERRIGFFFRLRFDQPVTIPRPLGHSSHFGLGIFVPFTPN